MRLIAHIILLVVVALGQQLVSGSRVEFSANGPGYPQINPGVCEEGPVGASTFPRLFKCSYTLQLSWDVHFRIATEFRFAQGAPYADVSVGFTTSVIPLRDPDLADQISKAMADYNSFDFGAVMRRAPRCALAQALIRTVVSSSRSEIRRFDSAATSRRTRMGRST